MLTWGILPPGIRLPENLEDGREQPSNFITYVLEHLIFLDWCSMLIAYLIFVISFTPAGFSKTKFYTQKTTEDTKNTKNVSKKVKYMQFFYSIWKNLHRAKFFYTSTACGACDKYEVWQKSCI